MEKNSATRGRGSTSNPSSRFERLGYDDADQDVVQPDEFDDDAPARPRTEFFRDSSASIVAQNESPDVGFDASINPYRGCEHGCVYCYARPTHSYLNLSPGLDFETRLFAKINAADLLVRELTAPGYDVEYIAIGSATDAYQPIERELCITRAILEVLERARHPLGVVTKSALVERDIDLLAPMAEERLAEVFVSITTLDSTLSRILEPRAASPQRRLRSPGSSLRVTPSG